MPNWVRNIVSFGDEKVIKELVNKNEHEIIEFDFNKVIPMPEELDEESDRYIEKLSIEEKLLFQKEYEGINDWYDWRIRYWDTKWNASETVVLNKKKVMFDTAWSAPFKIFRKISEMYHTKVVVRYADEGIMENSGKIIYEDGVEISYTQGDERFCSRIWNT